MWAMANAPPSFVSIPPDQSIAAALEGTETEAWCTHGGGFAHSWPGEKSVHEHGANRKRTGARSYSLDDSARHAGSPANGAIQLRIRLDRGRLSAVPAAA